MKLQKTFLILCAAIITVVTTATTGAQTPQSKKQYQQMTLSERQEFVASQARSIAHRMSGANYEFTNDFENEIHQALEAYVRRIGNNAGDRLWKGDARLVFERGQVVAPNLINSFRAQNVSPIIGLYVALIESEYVNIQSPNSVGALGMFQFLPKTGERFGLTAQDLLNVDKAADAAARYIAGNLKRFKDDRMKEALALLAYNRGEGAVERDRATFVNDRNNSCSICALTAEREKLDETFQTENVHYVPRFFAAAIMGENPQAFGLQIEPLSSYEIKR